jgi:hypothetical protein
MKRFILIAFAVLTIAVLTAPRGTAHLADPKATPTPLKCGMYCEPDNRGGCICRPF